MRIPFRFFATILLLLLYSVSERVVSQTQSFDFKRYLFGTLPTLTLDVESLNTVSGAVTIDGSDAQSPSTPYSWLWGDGSTSTGFPPQNHTYLNLGTNYIVKVLATYAGGGKDSVEVVVRFALPDITPISISPDIAVTIPDSNVVLISREPGYGFSGSLSYFDDRFFVTYPRSLAEYVASVAATVERDFVNNDLFLINGKFQQVMLRDSAAGGAYSIWYSSPVAFGVGDVFLTGVPGYSSLFHEMGHNMTLNSPADYYYGGKIDGDANAIFSETMAQIFQHAAGYEIINNYRTYGLSDDLMIDIESSVISSVELIRTSYDEYVSSGKKFASWNNPSTPADETFNTFMTIAYKFMEQAEITGQGYRVPLKRMMTLLQGFNSSWQQQYAPLTNTAAADTFRATLMASAVSFAFGKDLRSDFRTLNFPISDRIYTELYSSVSSVGRSRFSPPLRFELGNSFPNPANPSATISYAVPARSHVTLAVFNTLGQRVAELVSGEKDAGAYSVTFDASTVASGIYLYRMECGGFVQTKKMVVVK